MRNLPPVQHFLKNTLLAGRNKKAGIPHLVMLEGGPGSGKHDILSRLSKFGYTRYTDVSKQYPFLPPRHPLVSSAWSTRFLDSVYYHAVPSSSSPPSSSPSSSSSDSSSSSSLPSPRENTVFFSRSFLSPFIHDPTPSSQQLIQTMKDLKERWNITVVWCHADPHISKQRVQGRFMLADDDKKRFYEQVGETQESLLDEYEARYEQIEKEGGIIDVTIPTTSSKQAVANLLALLDFQWSPPKWDKIRKLVENEN